MQQQPSRKQTKRQLQKELARRPPQDLPKPPEPPAQWKPMG
jgi:hypothetical protein